MKFQVLQENLKENVSIASRFTSSRAQLPVLSNLLLSAKNNKLMISATNLEMSINLTVGAKVEEAGEITVPARTIGDIVSNLNPGKVEISSDKENLIIKSDNFRSKMAAMNSSDFPSIPQEIGKSPVSFSKEEIDNALSKTLFSISTDETRPVLTGMLVHIKNKNMYFVSTDGYRLSMLKLSKVPDGNFSNLIIPRTILGELPRLMSQDEVLFNFDKKNSQLIIKSSNAIVSSRIIEGEFPDFAKIIPKKTSTKTLIDKEDMLRSVKLASVFARDSANVVRLVIEKNLLTILAESQYSGEQKNSVDAKIEGPKMQIAFNYKFLEDFLQSVDGDDVSLEFEDPNSPGVFKDPKDEGYLHIIMPVKI
jgi:DNA polymerase-3 subunit beta